MIEVELPDGSIAEFPDGTAPDVMKQALQKRFGAPQKPMQGPPMYRPFQPGEKRMNPDGSHSTEITTTWQQPDGQWVNAPSLWMGPNGPTQFEENDEQGIMGALRNYEQLRGPYVKRFGSVDDAVAAAEAKSAAGGVSGGPQASTGYDMLRSAGTGIRQGVEGLAGMMGDVNQMQGDIAGWVAGKFGASPETQANVSGVASRFSMNPFAASTKDIQGATTGLVGEHYQPQTTAGEYARTAGQFAPAAVAGPGSVLRKAAMTAVPAIASETAGQATKGTAAEPYARSIGALAGGVAAAGRSVAKAPAAPSAEQLRQQGSALYDQAKNAGVTVKADAINKIGMNLGVKLRDFGFDKQLQPDTAVAIRKLIEVKGKDISLQEMDNIRKVAANAARSAVKADDRKAASILVEQIDNVMDDAANFSVRDNAGIKALKEGREVWKRKIKTDMLDEAVEKAQNQATGFENGLVIQMRAIANNPKKMRAFNKQEQAMIKSVVRRGSAHGVLRALGMLSPNSTFGGLMTGGVGVGAGIVPGAALAATGFGARTAAGALTKSKVDKLQSAVASGVSKSGPQPVSIEALVRSLLSAKAGENSAKSNAAVQQ